MRTTTSEKVAFSAVLIGLVAIGIMLLLAFLRYYNLPLF